MSMKVIISFGIIVLIVLIVAVAYVLRPSAEASQAIEAVPIQAESETVVETQEMEEETSDPAAAEAESASETEADETLSQEILDTEPVLFSIVQTESEARFTLDEILRGNPKTVIGSTDQIAGELAVDFTSPQNSQLGIIQVNARTLISDNDFRNRAINNEILDTGQFEYITFSPTSISGLPESITMGEAVVFMIDGDLTIRDITHPVTFEISLTIESDTQLQGYASATVARADYDLQIPSVPNVADVDEQVLIEIEFVASSK